MTDAEPYFVDTNVFIAASDPDRPDHEQAIRILQAGLDGNVILLLSGQVLREYRVVVTRPAKVNGLGLSSKAAGENIESFLGLAGFLEEDKQVHERLHLLASQLGLKGKRIHDANIAATVLRHGFYQILTSNPGDFKAFGEIKTVALADVSV